MQFLEQQVLFRSGEDDYAGYRIPALLTTGRGTVLAFCEARKDSLRDTDQIDLYVRRSDDAGRTFGARILVATAPDMVSGNPAPVVDRHSGRIILPFCRNPRSGDEAAICRGQARRTVWLTYSDDDGLTWAEPREITAQVKREDWTWYATGPGHSVQLEHGPHQGRLVVACDHIVYQQGTRSDPYHAHLIFSDDGGQHWAIGAISDEGANESTVAEASDGQIYWNCRNKSTGSSEGTFRRVAWSADGGQTASPLVHDAALPESICQASVLSCTLEGAPAFLFANEADPQQRRSLTVRLSRDQGRTWPSSRVLHEGFSAYCDLATVEDGTILCLYEWGDTGRYEALVLARFSLSWLTNTL